MRTPSPTPRRRGRRLACALAAALAATALMNGPLVPSATAEDTPTDAGHAHVHDDGPDPATEGIPNRLRASARVSSVLPKASFHVPAQPTGMPRGIEALGRYLPANSCDPTPKPGVVAFGQLLEATYPATSHHVPRTCGTGLPTSEHYDGRALDWFTDVRTSTGLRRGNALVNWLLATDRLGQAHANARRLGVMYIIWNDRIWGAYRAAEGWRSYNGCPSRPAAAYDTTCHRDHVHISFTWEGAMGRTSFWTRTVAPVDHGTCRPADLSWAAAYRSPRATPCPSYPEVSVPAGASATHRELVRYSGIEIRPGQQGPAVTAVQRAVGAAADGVYGPRTRTAVDAFKRARGLPADGFVDHATWRALLRATRPGAAPTPSPAPSPAPTPGQPYADLARFGEQVLARGARGAAVTAVRARLRVPAGSVFDTATWNAVRVFQARAGIPITGRVDVATWRAMYAPDPAPPRARYAALARYDHLVLRQGSARYAVKVLRGRLGLSRATNRYGPWVVTNVRRFQRDAGLRTTGVVDRATWHRLVR